ncbi:unnamed protein product [Parajaminaea phylloscopi]
MPGHRAATTSAASSTATRQSRTSSIALSHPGADQLRFVDTSYDAAADGQHQNQLMDEDPAIAERLHSAHVSPVYPTLQLILTDVRATIDTSLSWDELTGHDLNFAIVRPLARKYSRLHNQAILYALLVTRIHFVREADRDLANQNISNTRADLCELLAMKLLRTFASSGNSLVSALGTPFWPFSGAPEEVLQNAQRLGYATKDPMLEATSTLQLAVYSSAKKFVATPLVQKCIDGIWMGQVVLGNSSTTGHAIIDDSYKKRPVTIYNPARAPFLDHRRLRVPRIRSFLEAANFLAILFAYIICLRSEGTAYWTASETIFSIWLVGLAIDELAQIQEHGWTVYASSLFNILDGLFCAIGFAWMGIRISGLVAGSMARSNAAFDVLSLGAILLCPRVASLLVSDNVLLLALRAMVVEFSYFLGLALVFFAGFLWTFWSLSDSRKWTPATIGWLMLRFTFGNTISFEEAQEFSPTFGPWLVVAFTILAQTLLLTILISLLSATFSRVAEHAQEESLYQHAYSTLQGVSSEALFSYVPPLNILCILIVLPASFFLTPRWIHKLNVFVIRVTHLPILMGIRLAERSNYGNTGIEPLSQQEAESQRRSGLGQAVQALKGRWKRTKRKTQSDIIEVVFANLLDEEVVRGDNAAQDSETTKTPSGGILQRRKALRMAHGDDVGTAADVAPQGQAATSGPHVRDARSGAPKSFDRVLTTESTMDTLPDSPGATIRRMRDAYAATSNRNTVAFQSTKDGATGDSSMDRDQPQTASGATGLSRHDTFASLFSPRAERRRYGRARGKASGQTDVHKRTSRDSPATVRDTDVKRAETEAADSTQELRDRRQDTMSPVVEDAGGPDAHEIDAPYQQPIAPSTSRTDIEQSGLDGSADREPSMHERRSRSESHSRSRSRRGRAISRSSSRNSGNSGQTSGLSDDRDESPSGLSEDSVQRNLEAVMMGFLDRLDEQAAVNERIEAMLAQVLSNRDLAKTSPLDTEVTGR